MVTKTLLELLMPKKKKKKKKIILIGFLNISVPSA